MEIELDSDLGDGVIAGVNAELFFLLVVVEGEKFALSSSFYFDFEFFFFLVEVEALLSYRQIP